MKKLVILSLIAPAVLGLAACGGNQAANGPIVSNDVMMNADDMNTMGDDNMSTMNDTVPADNVANAN